MTDVRTAPVQAASLRPAWRAARWWLVLLALLVVAGFGLALGQPAPGRSLDPASGSKDGSRALSVLLAQRGTTSRAVSSYTAALSTPGATTIVVTSPDDFSTAQLRQLAAGHRLVAVTPSPDSLDALAPGRGQQFSDDDAAVSPDCGWPGAAATGSVEFPAGADVYTGSGSCYGGRVIITDQLVILGATATLTNGTIGNGHLAALAMNALSDDGSVSTVVWLLPGADAEGSGPPSVWSIFPPWIGRATWQLALIGLLVAFWRGRRLGPVVGEPLPVVVRAAEVVEGHGRLYLRAAARERAAAALRAGTVRRLAARLHLRPTATPVDVAVALGVPAALLTGAAPPDDPAMIELGRQLIETENRARTNGATR